MNLEGTGQPGTLGDFVVAFGDGATHDADSHAKALLDARRWPLLPMVGAGPVQHQRIGAQLCIWWRGAVQVLPTQRGGLGLSLEPAQSLARNQQPNALKALFEQAASGVEAEIQGLRGRFAWVQWDVGVMQGQRGAAPGPTL